MLYVLSLGGGVEDGRALSFHSFRSNEGGGGKINLSPSIVICTVRKEKVSAASALSFFSPTKEGGSNKCNVLRLPKEGANALAIRK